MRLLIRRLHTGSSFASKAVKHLHQPMDKHGQQEQGQDRNAEALEQYYTAHTGSPEHSSYILTLFTDEPLHKTVTALRNQYFPPQLNKVPAHLTLFHALPGSKLESDIVPTIQRVTSETTAFDIHPGWPFRMSKGIAIAIPKFRGGNQASDVRRALQQQWLDDGFLSPQDARGANIHWTIMNKVNDEKYITEAMHELEESWKRPSGQALGVALWKYEIDGRWSAERRFNFARPMPGHTSKS